MSISNKISVIVINYKSAYYIDKLLKSIIRYRIKDIDEILIINNSPEESNEINRLIKNNTQQKISQIENNHNIGFACAANQGIKNANNDLVLLLNPDTLIIDRNSIRKLITTINSDFKIGAVGGKILKSDKKNYQLSATGPVSFLVGVFEFTIIKRFFPQNRWSYNFWLENKQKNRLIKATSLCGAFMLFRKIINNETVLFDEEFFLYLEDIDFGIRINNMKHKVILNTHAKILHHGGRSNQNRYRTDLHNWYLSRKMLFSKYLPPYQYFFIYIIFIIEESFLNLYHFLKNESAY